MTDTNGDNADWAEVARTRQGLYRFFAEALLPPTGEQLELLTGAAAILEDRDLDRFAFSRDFRRLADQLPTDVRGSTIDVEYVRLFASGMSRALSPPTESYYRVVAQGGAIADFVATLQREYRAMGIGSVGLEEAPDHISTELRVCAHLCDLEAGAWESDQPILAGDVSDMQVEFLGRHLAAWLPPFRNRVHAAGPLGFYRNVIDAVHAFVVHDYDFARTIRTEMSV